MNLIDFYTREVGQQLPEKMRADIEKEIRSLIEDMIEDEVEKTGREPDEDLIVSVLKQMGSPEKVAASYLPPRYLIGPELFPHFIRTLRLVISIVVVVTAVLLGLSLGSPTQAPVNLIDVFARVLGGLLDAAFSATAIVVIIFAIIQFASPGLKLKEEEWDPRKLKAEPDPQKVSIPGAIGEIVANVLAVVVFNLYPEWISLTSLVNGEWVHVPILTDDFLRYVPWLTVLWALEIGLNTWLIAQGRWTAAQRWASIALALASIIILGSILAGSTIIALDVQNLAQLGWDLSPEAAEGLVMGLNLSVRLALGIVIALQVVEIGKSLYKLLRGRLPEPITLTK